MRIRLLIMLAISFLTGRAATSPTGDDDYAAITAEGTPIVKRILEQNALLKAARTAEEAASILTGYQTAVAYFMALMERYSDSSVAPDFLMRQLTGFPPNEISKAWLSISEKVRAEDTETNRALKSIVAEYSRLDKGKPAPPFATVDTWGDSIRLSDYQGKTVLLDFWASWCGPCRANMPHVMELYRKYHEAGFEVICVAADDNNPEAWLEAIGKDGTGELHHVLRGMRPRKPAMPVPSTPAAAQGLPIPPSGAQGLPTPPSGSQAPATASPGFVPGLTRIGAPEDLEHTSDIGAKYAVHAMPMHYLIAADGTIIGEMSGGLLEYHLQQIYGF